MSGALKTPRPPKYPKPPLAASKNQLDIWRPALLGEISKFLSPEDKSTLSYLDKYFWKNRDLIIDHPLPSFFKGNITEEALQIRLAGYCLDLLGITHPPDQPLGLKKSFSNTVAEYCINLEARLESHLLPNSSSFLWASLYGSFPKANLGFYLQQFVKQALNPNTAFPFTRDLALFHDILSVLSALGILNTLASKLDALKTWPDTSEEKIEPEKATSALITSSSSLSPDEILLEASFEEEEKEEPSQNNNFGEREENIPVWEIIKETAFNPSKRNASPRILFILQHLKGLYPSKHRDSNVRQNQDHIATIKPDDLGPNTKGFAAARTTVLETLLEFDKGHYLRRLSESEVQEYLWQGFSPLIKWHLAIALIYSDIVYQEYDPLFRRFSKFPLLLEPKKLDIHGPSWSIKYHSRSYPLSNTSVPLDRAIEMAKLLLPKPIKGIYIENWRTISCYESPFSSVGGQAAAIHPYFLMLLGLSISISPFKLEEQDIPTLISSAIPRDYNICRLSEQTYITCSEEDIQNLFRRLPSDDHLAELNGRYYALSLIFKKFNRINLHIRCLLAIKLLHNELAARHPSQAARSIALQRGAQNYAFGTLSEDSIEDFCAHTQNQEEKGPPPPVIAKLTPPKLPSRSSTIREYVGAFLFFCALAIAIEATAAALCAGIIWLPSVLPNSFICPLLLASGSTMALFCLLTLCIFGVLAISSSSRIEVIIQSKLRYINVALVFSCLLMLTETTLLATQAITSWTFSIIVQSTQASVFVGPNMLIDAIGVLACLLTLLYILYKINRSEKIQPPKPMLHFDTASQAKNRLSAQGLKQPTPAPTRLIPGWGAQAKPSQQVKAEPRITRAQAIGSL